jgi:NADH-quinone oxidoreductase subunit B
LQKKIDTQSIRTVRWYSKEPDKPAVVPVLGPDIMDPRQFALIKAHTEKKLQEATEVAKEASE